jgi:hypothetical protein
VRTDAKLVSLESAVVLEYPYRRWIPYTITASGLALGLGGIGVWLLGREQLSDFEGAFARECPTGCSLSDQPLLRDLRDGAKLRGAIGVTMMVAGGAVAVGGIVMVIVNRPRRILPNVEVSPTRGGVMATKAWEF